LRSRHRLLGRGGAQIGGPQPCHRDGCLWRARGAQLVQGLAHLPSTQEQIELRGQLGNIVLDGAQEGRPLDDDDQVDHRQTEQDPHHPRGLEIEQGVFEQFNQ
jgi:hypothetical protein